MPIDDLVGDIRYAAFAGPYDLAMILFGQFNVLAPAETRTTLGKSRRRSSPKAA